MTTYYRIHDTERCAPEDLLRPEHQRSDVWCGTVAVRCVACGGCGEDLDGDPCDACRGDGYREIESQHGVSVCRSIAALESYLSGRSPYRHERVVLLALEGVELDEEDVDREDGAVLVRPTRIVEVMSLDEIDGVEWGAC